MHEKVDSLIKRSEDRSFSNDDDRQNHMHQTLLSSNRVVIINNTKEDEDLYLFDKINIANQEDIHSNAIKTAINQKKKKFDEILLKKFKIMKNTLFFRDKL